MEWKGEGKERGPGSNSLGKGLLVESGGQEMTGSQREIRETERSTVALEVRVCARACACVHARACMCDAKCQSGPGGTMEASEPGSECSEVWVGAHRKRTKKEELSKEVATLGWE